MISKKELKKIKTRRLIITSLKELLCIFGGVVMGSWYGIIFQIKGLIILFVADYLEIFPRSTELTTLLLMASALFGVSKMLRWTDSFRYDLKLR